MRDIATPPIDSAHMAARELADESRTARPGKNTLRKIGFAFWTVAILLMSTVSATATARNATSLPWSAAPSTVIVTESKTFRSGDASTEKRLGGKECVSTVKTRGMAEK